MRTVLVVLLFVLFACSDDSAGTASPKAVSQTAQTPSVTALPTVAAPSQTVQTPSVTALPTAAAPSQADQTPSITALPAATAPSQTDQAPSIASLPASEPLKVVTSANFIADWVTNIGGERVEVKALLPIGADPHVYQPSARAVADIADADLVLTIGLNLEAHWLEELVKNAARDPSTVVALADVVEPIDFVEIHGDDDERERGDADHDHDHEHEDEDADHDHDHDNGDADHDHEDEDADHDHDHDHDNGDADHDHAHDDDDDMHDHEHGPLDPHFWFDPLRVKKTVWDISARLGVLDPPSAEFYRSNAESYNAKLDELHAWTLEQVAQVPEERRLLVTSHDSLGYFANLYGFKVLGAILSTATEAEPSADDIATLSQRVERYGVPAVFGEITISERLANTVASESGARLVRLHSESLGHEGSGAETYLEMMRTNVTNIVEALK